MSKTSWSKTQFYFQICLNHKNENENDNWIGITRVTEEKKHIIQLFAIGTKERYLLSIYLGRVFLELI